MRTAPTRSNGSDQYCHQTIWLPGTGVTANRDTRQGRTTTVWIWVSVLIVCVLLLFYLATNPFQPGVPVLPLPPVLPSQTENLPSQIEKRAKFFDDKVQSAVAAADKANRDAAERCLQQLRDSFVKRRQGIAPFTDDVTSMWTRLGVLGRMPSDWWYRQTANQKNITEKFETHIFSEQTLRGSLQGAISKFREDVDANSNELLISIQAAISKSQLPQLPMLDHSGFHSDVTHCVEKFANDSVTGNVKNWVLTEIISGVAGYAAQQVVVALSTQIASMVGTSSAAAGGTTVAGATVGGGGGSAAGPIGTIVGVGVGLVVGVAADWWMTTSFKTQLATTLNNLVSNVENSTIMGTTERPGLKQSLDESCDALRDAYRQALYDRIVKEPTP